MNKQELIDKSKEIRRMVLQKVACAKSSHVGSMLSIVDIMVYLFYKEIDFTKKNYHKTPRDRFILSKGHASLTLYSILLDKGIIEDLDSYCQDSGYLIGHLNHKVEGVEFSTGSLGHGLPMATGLSLSYKMDNIPNRVYCLIGDGECDEGSIWESLIFISNNNLKSLIILIDANKLQGYDFCDRILPESRLVSMLKSTGLNFYEIDGHNFDEIGKVFQAIKNNDNEKATIVFLHTVKGKGISFMENRLEWHYKSPNEEQLKEALEELK